MAESFVIQNSMGNAIEAKDGSVVFLSNLDRIESKTGFVADVDNKSSVVITNVNKVMGASGLAKVSNKSRFAVINCASVSVKSGDSFSVSADESSRVFLTNIKNLNLSGNVGFYFNKGSVLNLSGIGCIVTSASDFIIASEKSNIIINGVGSNIVGNVKITDSSFVTSNTQNYSGTVIVSANSNNKYQVNFDGCTFQGSCSFSNVNLKLSNIISSGTIVLYETSTEFVRCSVQSMSIDKSVFNIVNSAINNITASDSSGELHLSSGSSLSGSNSSIQLYASSFATVTSTGSGGVISLSSSGKVDGRTGGAILSTNDSKLHLNSKTFEQNVSSTSVLNFVGSVTETYSSSLTQNIRSFLTQQAQSINSTSQSTINITASGVINIAGSTVNLGTLVNLGV